MLATLGCESNKEQTAPAPTEPAAVEDKAPKAQPGIALPETTGGKVGVKLPQGAVAEPAPEVGAAERCTWDVPVPAAGCSSRSIGGIAVVGDDLYVVQRALGVRRYRVATTGPCALTLDKGFGTSGVLANPEVAPTQQKVGDGPVYLRSGGTDYGVVAAPGGAVYIYDFLDGIHRVAGVKGFARCTSVSGVRAVAWRGGQPLAVRNDDLYTVSTKGAGCTLTTPWKMPLRPNSILGAGDRLFASGADADGKNRVFELDAKGKKLWVAGNDDSFAADGLCWAGALADCGDAVCVLDGNCNKVSRFAKSDGSFVGAARNRDLFGPDVYKVEGLTAGGASLWASVSLRDTHSDECQAAIFRLPAP